MNKKSIIIDTDPGIDDALALACALTNDKFDVKLVTSVAGNVSIDNTTRNALNIVSMFKDDLDVAKGCEKPLIYDLQTASHIHGINGIGDVVLPVSNKKVLDKHAVLAIKECLDNSDDKITIVTLGALTNIALLLSLYPEVVDKIEQIVMMGGAIGKGNATSVAEFNFYVDPHALDIVFKADIKKVIIPLNATHMANITLEDVFFLKDGNAIQKSIYAMLIAYQNNYLCSNDPKTVMSLHDVCTIAYLDNDKLFKMVDKDLVVCLNGYSRGAIVENIDGEFNSSVSVKVAMEANSSLFKEWLVNNLKNI